MISEQEEPFDLGAKLKERLIATKAQKESIQAKVNQLNDELQKLFVKIPKKPRESMTELNEKIAALEFQRTTTSLILSEEKQILREIKGIERSKDQLVEYNAYEQKIQEKKAHLGEFRDSLKKTNAAIDELEAALAKVRLAQKLGCAPSELTTMSVDCPSDKIGRVIGKSGANIRQIEERTRVTMDVDSVASKIQLTGTQASIQHASSEIDKIIMAIDEDLHVAPELLNYLTTKRISTMGNIRKAHPDVQIDALREKGIIGLRGLPECVARAKEDILELRMETDKRTVTGKEAGILVGKGGSTINKLVDAHEVTIDIDETGDDVWTATVVGPGDRVEGAMEEIDEIMRANKDVVFEVAVDQVVRNTLLTDAGAPIKNLQKEVNEQVKGMGVILLSFNKEVSSSGDQSNLLIKGRLAAVTEAKDIVERVVQQINDSLVTIDVDPFIIPKIIGKGGETIKMLKNGKSVNIEVDKSVGRVVIQSQDEAEVQRVADEVNAIVEANQLERIDYDPALVKKMFMDIRHSKEKEKISELAWIGLDDDAAQIILRGPAEDIKKAAEMVREYILCNYIEEVQISAEDEPTLLAGGADSVVNKLANEYEVDLSLNRGKLVIQAKGEKEKVQKAVKRLNQFLHGGDGHTVSRIAVTEQALGVVIGKSGKKREELERTHEGVNIFIHRSNRITIRGPEATVEECRMDILRLVSSVRIQQLMPLTPEQYESLSRPDVIRRATNGIPVNVTLTETTLKIRGIFADVRDAQALLKEQMTGVYESRVELDASQLTCVRGATRDPSHFQRIQETSNAVVTLDNNSSAIVISGKRFQVKKAKGLVIGFLEFLLPDDFSRFKISKPLQSSVGEAAALADISAVSGATVILDRDLSSIQVQSSDPEKIKKAEAILKERIANAEKKAFVISFVQSESWLIPLIIGKGGNRVNSLRLETGCQIDINKTERTVTVTGDDEDGVAKAKASLNQMIDTARRQCAFMELPGDAIPSFLGRSGAHVRSFASEHKVEVERLRKEPCKVKITGEESAVQSAKQALLAWIAAWEEQQAGLTMQIDRASIPVILGKSGAVISSLQKEFHCKVDINRDELTLTIRAGTEEQRTAAMEKIRDLIQHDKANQEKRNARQENGVPGTISTDGEKQPRESHQQQQQKQTGVIDGRKDRSGEFAARPVGLTVEEPPSKPKRKRNRNKNKGGSSNNNNNNDIADDSTLQVGSAAGRNLFNLLISDESPYSATTNAADDEKHGSSAVISANETRFGVMVTTEEQWDSSTVSSAEGGGNGGGDGGGGRGGPVVVHDRATNKSYIKSASGFSVRV